MPFHLKSAVDLLSLQHDCHADNKHGQDTRQQLDHLRPQTSINTEMLSAVLTAVQQRLSVTDNPFRQLMSLFVDPAMSLMPKIDLYRILGHLCVITLTGIVGFLLVSFCILTLASSTHFRVAEHSVSIAVVLMSLASIAITGYGLLSLAVGGQAHVFLCRHSHSSGPSSSTPKDIQYNHYSPDVAVGNNSYDNKQPDGFRLPEIVGHLFDQPPSGIIANLLRPPDVNYSLVNVSLTSALRYLNYLFTVSLNIHSYPFDINKKTLFAGGIVLRCVWFECICAEDSKDSGLASILHTFHRLRDSANFRTFSLASSTRF